MELMITCPVDGPVEVTLEDIDTVVLREPEQAEIIFACPKCGTEVSMTVRVPSFLMAAIEAMAEDGGGRTAPLASMMAFAVEVEIPEDVESVEDDEDFTDSYCEYFRRQLSDIETVDDIMHEINCDD